MKRNLNNLVQVVILQKCDQFSERQFTFLNFVKVYLVGGGDGQREGERENPNQTLHCQCRPRHGA